MKLKKNSSLVFRDLVGLFLRAKTVRLSTIISAIPGFAIIVILCIAQSLTLSNAQESQRSLGISDAVYTGVPEQRLGSPANEGSDLVDLATAAGATEARIHLLSRDLQGDGVAGDWIYEEDSWEQNVFPERISLSLGSWPRTSGEVCVSAPLGETLPIGTKASLFNGAIPFEVVCIAHDRFSTADKSIFAAPGTWRQAIQNSDEETNQRWASTASASLIYSAEEPLLVFEALQNYGEIEGQSGEYDAFASPIQFSNDLDPKPRTIEAGLPNPFILEIPRWGFPALVGIIGGLIISRFLARSQRILHTVGVPLHSVKYAGTVAAGVSGAIGSLLGSMFGVVIGLSVHYLLGLFLPRPVGPIVGIAPTIFIVFLVTLVCCSSAFLLVSPKSFDLKNNVFKSASKRSKIPDRRNYFTNNTTLFLSLAALVVLAIYIARNADSTSALLVAVSLIGVACSLCVKPIVNFISNRNTSDLGILLGFRKVQETRFATLISSIISLLLIVSIGILSTFASAVSGFNESTESLVPSGQARLQIEDSSSIDNFDQIRGEIQSKVDISGIDYVVLNAFTSTADGPLSAVASVDDLESILGTRLSSVQRSEVEAGAVLRVNETPTGKIDIQNPESGEVVANLSASQISGLDPAFRNSGGYLLENTAKRHGIAPAFPGVAYTDISQEQIQLMKGLPDKLNFSSYWLKFHVEPDDLKVPAQIVSAGALLTFVTALVTLIYSISIGRQLRPMVGGLWAIGLRRTWILKAVMAHMGLTVLAGALVGLIGSYISIYTVLALAPVGIPVVIPWQLLVMILVGLTFGLFAGYLFSAKNVSLETFNEKNK